MKNAIKTGDTVVLLDSEHLANVLCEVCDSRIQNGIYTYTIAPITSTGVDCARALSGVWADELRKVRA